MPVSNTLGTLWNDPTGSTLPPLEGNSTLEEDDKALVDDLRRIWEYEHKQRAFHERRWQRSIDRKNLIFDFSRKRPWQSRRVIPGYTILCHKVAWELTKPVALATGPLFEATTDLDPWRELLDIPTEILQDAIKSEGVNAPSDLTSAWFTAMDTMAETGNAYLLIVPETEGTIDLRPTSEEEIFGGEEEEPLPTLNNSPLPSLGLPSLDEDDDDFPTIDELAKKPKIRFEALNPMDTFIDTANPKRPTFVMWRQFLMPWQFEEMAIRHGWDNVEEILKEHKRSTSNEANSQQITARNNVVNSGVKPINNICVHFFVGTLPGDKGKARFTNKFAVWSGQHICSRPKDLGFKHGQLPIIHGGMLERAFGAYADSLAAINLDPQEARNEMMNSLLDYMNQVINPPTEVDHNQLHSAIGAKQLAHGLTPGGLIHTQKTGNGPAIARSQVPEMPSGMWQGLGYIDQRAQETTGLADIGSMPRTRNRISADEAAERQAMSGGIWQKCLLQIENKFLAVALQQAWLLGLQITSDEVWRAKIRKRIQKLQNLNNQPIPPTDSSEEDASTESDSQINPNSPLLAKLAKMEKWDSKTRWRKMAAAFTFIPKVFSSVESRRRGLEQMQYLVDFSSAVPGMMQSVLWPKVTENVLIQLMLDPTDYLRKDAYDLPPPVDPSMQPPQQSSPGAPVPVNPVVPPPPAQR